MTPPPRASIGKRLLYSGVMLCIVMGTAEALSRLLGGEVLDQAASPPPVSKDGKPNLLGNPYLLYEMAPGQRYERGVDIAINSHGLRGGEWTPEKPAGVRRIMALGDSSVYGFGVEDDEVFTARLEEHLGEGAEVLNAAVPGYSTYQTINLLQIRALAFQPDLLLVGCIWSDNNFDSFVDRELLAAYSSFRNSYARGLHALLERSALYTILDYKLRVLRKFPEERRVGWMVGRGEKVGERRVPIQEYARNLETIVELAHDHGSEVAFMVLPNRDDLEDQPESGAAWDPYRQVMRDTALRHGAPVVDLPALFIGSGRSADDLFLDEMHPTALGHHLWGEAVHSALEERGWSAGEPVERDPAPSPIPSYADPYVEGDHAPPEGADPAQHPQPQQASAAGRVVGELLVPDPYLGHPIQLDAVQAGPGSPTILGSLRAEGPGPFELWLNDGADAVSFVAYVDRNGDGPSAGDDRIELHSAGLPLPDGGVLEGLVLDLGAGVTTQTFDGGGGQDEPAAPAESGADGVIVTDQSTPSGGPP
jgi:lysophospholipase L1-like esterase